MKRGLNAGSPGRAKVGRTATGAALVLAAMSAAPAAARAEEPAAGTAATDSGAGNAAAPGAAPAKAPTSAAEAVAPGSDLLPPDGARWRVLIAGLGLFAGSYGGMAVMGAAWSEVPGSERLFYPVAGPWIALAESGCAPSEETTVGEGDCEGMMGLRGVIYSVAGLLQVGSLGLVAESIFMSTESSAAPKKAQILPVPFVTGDSVGVGVIGTF